MQYDGLMNAADAKNKTASKRIQVHDGALEGLITKAKSEFVLKDDFAPVEHFAEKMLGSYFQR